VKAQLEILRFRKHARHRHWHSESIFPDSWTIALLPTIYEIHSTIFEKMAFKQPTNKVNAGVLGNEPNIGVKGLRNRARSDSDALRTFENPQDIPVV
jgi:hypothetical protein